jgi:hypothetical protein
MSNAKSPGEFAGALVGHARRLVGFAFPAPAEQTLNAPDRASAPKQL